MKNLKTEYVYVIAMDGHHTYYKIGRTKNLQKRLKELQTGNPYVLRVVFFIETTNSIALEDYLHTRFQKLHILGEWYCLGEKQFILLKQYFNRGVEEWA